MMTKIPSTRMLNLAAFISCAGLLGYSGWLQFGLGLEICPLCVVQRLLFVAAGVLFLLAALINPDRGGRISFGVIITLVGLFGLVVAGRHVWLQGLPADQIPSCGPGLEYIVETFEPWEALSMVLGGSGECAEVKWQFLGLTIPGWSLLWFAGFSLFGIFQIFRREGPTE